MEEKEKTGGGKGVDRERGAKSRKDSSARSGKGGTGVVYVEG